MSKVQMRTTTLIPTGGITYKDYLKLFEDQKPGEIITVDAIGELTDSEDISGFRGYVNSLTTKLDNDFTLTTSGHPVIKEGILENGYQSGPSKDTEYLYTIGDAKSRHMLFVIHPQLDVPEQGREEGIKFHKQAIQAYLDAVEKGEVKPNGVAIGKLIDLAMELEEKEPAKIRRVLNF